MRMLVIKVIPSTEKVGSLYSTQRWNASHVIRLTSLQIMSVSHMSCYPCKRVLFKELQKSWLFQ